MGIRHIYASTQHDLFFAQGYVHAQDRFWQMDFWRHIGSARLSEMFPSEVDTDTFAEAFKKKSGRLRGAVMLAGPPLFADRLEAARQNVRPQSGAQAHALQTLTRLSYVPSEMIAEVSERTVPTLAILVDDADAVYPVRIDPTFSDANWISMGSLPGADGLVLAAVVDGSGNLYIGGAFTVAGGVAASEDGVKELGADDGHGCLPAGEFAAGPLDAPGHRGELAFPADQFLGDRKLDEEDAVVLTVIAFQNA